MTLSDVAQALPLLIVVLVVLAARRNLRRVPDWGPVRKEMQLKRDEGGDLIVPVSQLVHRRTWSGSHNGLSPRLWITDTGLRFKVFKLSERSFADFERVEAHKSLFHGTRLIFVGPSEQLHALIANPDVARAVLLAFDLPPGCELRELVVAPAGDGSWPP